MSKLHKKIALGEQVIITWVEVLCNLIRCPEGEVIAWNHVKAIYTK